MPTVQSTIRKAREFADLSEGWHFGEGVPPSHENLGTAHSLLVKAEELEFDEADVFPGIDGEIQIAIYRGDDDYELTIERNGTITFVHDENGKELRYEQGLSLDDAIQTLVRVSDRIWPSLDLFTANTTIRRADDFVVWLSRTQATGQAYQLSKAAVLNVQAERSVNISPDFTLPWPENQSSIGQYLMTRFQLGVLSSKRTVNLATNAITTFKTGPMGILGGSLKHST